MRKRNKKKNGGKNDNDERISKRNIIEINDNN